MHGARWGPAIRSSPAWSIDHETRLVRREARREASVEPVWRESSTRCLEVFWGVVRPEAWLEKKGPRKGKLGSLEMTGNQWGV